MEKWLPIREFPSFEVSNKGKVRQGERLLTPYPHTGGYLAVEFKIPHKGQKVRRRRVIHRMVLSAFLSPCPEGHQATHKDGNNENNEVENLAWVPRRELRGKLTSESVYEIRLALEEGESQSSISNRYGVTRAAIGHISTGRTWRD